MTGVRQSRRVAALAEAPSHSPSHAHAAQQQGKTPHQQGRAPRQQGAAPHQQGAAPPQAEQPGATQSAALLQASTLEASANVLKGLVRVLTVRHAAQGLGCTPKILNLPHAAQDPKGMQPQDHTLDVQGGLAVLQGPRLHHA